MSEVIFGYHAVEGVLEQHPEWSKVVKAHRHKAANRYMVKIFLIKVYTAWRRIEGLVVYDPYHETKLGLVHDEEDAA